MALFFLARRFWMRRDVPRPARVMQGMVFSGVCLSVAALVTSLSVMSGFEREYKKALLDFNAHVLILPQGGQTLSEKQVRQAFEDSKIPGAELLRMTPYLYREGLLIHRGIIKGVVLKGVQNCAMYDVRCTKGEGIILGKALAEKLGITNIAHGTSHIAQVKLLIPKGKEVSAKNTKKFKVAGTFHSGLYEFDSQFVLIDLEILQNFFSLPQTFHGFELHLNDPEAAPAVASDLEIRLGPEVSVQDWASLNQPLFKALQLEKWVFRILMGLMVFVAALNLIGAVLLAIFRHQKTIAILRALGFPSSKIRKLFAWQGFSLGLGGIFFGTLLGGGLVIALRHYHWIALDPQIYFLEKLPVHFEPFTIFIIALSSLLLVWLTSWLAAGRAVTIPIRDGLHGPG